MNAEQIRSMEAGREMDALVAVHIFEREMCTTHLSLFCCGRGGGRYSTDIAAAWEVVEKITTPAPHVGDNYLPPNTIFAKLFDSGFVWAMSATEAAESICKWALIAVMGDES